MLKIAALFVEPKGAYSQLNEVEPWGLPIRDARKYLGNFPVVAHPPCARWCRLAKFVEKTYGQKVGDDSGCFASALANVRRCGGVLEHPAHSLAWVAYGIKPPPNGGAGYKRTIAEVIRAVCTSNAMATKRVKRLGYTRTVPLYPRCFGASPLKNRRAVSVPIQRYRALPRSLS